jgi:hypothetical protein
MIGGIPRGRVRTMSNSSARELTQSTAAVQEIGRGLRLLHFSAQTCLLMQSWRSFTTSYAAPLRVIAECRRPEVPS